MSVSSPFASPADARGFTLLEMAFVLVIIGILFATGFPIVKTLITQNKFSQDKAVVEESRQILIAYALSHAGLPLPVGDNLLPTNLLGARAANAYGKPLHYQVNENLTTAVTGKDPATFCENISVLINSNNMDLVPAICNAPDNTSQSCSNKTPVAFVVLSSGANGQLNDENGDNDTIFDNPSKTHSSRYDDIVMSYALTELLGDCQGV